MSRLAGLWTRAESCICTGAVAESAMSPDASISTEPVFDRGRGPAPDKQEILFKNNDIGALKNGPGHPAGGRREVCFLPSVAACTAAPAECRYRDTGPPMQIPLILDPSADQSLTSQLVGQLRDAIT